MAEKIGGRWQESVTTGSKFSGVELTVTRRGVEVHGWYDSIVGIESAELTWGELDAMRRRVREGSGPGYVG